MGLQSSLAGLTSAQVLTLSPPNLAIVRQGAIAALATGLDLATLSGYKHYRLLLILRGGLNNGNMLLTLNGDGSASYDSNALTGLAAVASNVQAADATSVIVIPANADSLAAHVMLDLNVDHDDAASSPISARWSAGIGASSTQNLNRHGFAILDTDVATITQITLAWDGTDVTGGSYVLYGMKDS